jgi:hypothetical protein
MADRVTTDVPLYRTSVKFNSIYVFESLAPGELKTGQELFDSVINPAAYRLGDIHVELHSVVTKEALLVQLDRIAYAARVGNHHPIVHIEAHGGPEGITLASGTRIGWRELIPSFEEINVACRNNLIVVAISCHGWDLTASLLPSDRAPVFMLIGPTRPMTAGELLDATHRFYEALFVEVNVNAALEAMNSPLPFAEWPIRPATAEILFCRLFRKYVEEHGSAEALDKREKNLVTRIARTRSLTVREADELRRSVRRDLADHGAAYDRHRKTFLMLDLHPEDVDRFGLTYELCFPSGGVRSQ